MRSTVSPGPTTGSSPSGRPSKRGSRGPRGTGRSTTAGWNYSTSVARMFGSAGTIEQRIAAAVLAAGAGAMTSHRSAARLWGVDRPDDDPVDVLLPRRTREASPAGAVVHRPRDRLDLRPVVRCRIVTTNILRWACDLGAVDPAGVEPAVGHILTNGLATAGALYTAVAGHDLSRGDRWPRGGLPGDRHTRRPLDGHPTSLTIAIWDESRAVCVGYTSLGLSRLPGPASRVRSRWGSSRQVGAPC